MLKKKKYPVFQRAEWEEAKQVLLFQPSLATLFGSLTPLAVNFTGSFSLSKAQQEHASFRAVLEENGVEVIEVGELLSQLHQEEDRLKLREAVTNSLQILSPKIPLQTIMNQLEPPDLVNLLLLQPHISLEPSPRAFDETTSYFANYRVKPVTNHYYMRDPLMTTAKGVVVCNLQLKERQMEVEIGELLLKVLGIKPILKVKDPGRVEGGDFIPAGDYVLQGQGLLTNREGVRQLLEMGAYGHVEVAVVIDANPTMDAMHLDTYFNFLRDDLAVIQKERVEGPLRPEVHIYRPKKGGYYGYHGSSFLPKYLASKGVTLIEFSAQEQKQFASNFLLLSKGKLIGVLGALEDYFKRIESYGVQAIKLDFSALTKGYGGPHCMSQVIRRV